MQSIRQTTRTLAPLLAVAVAGVLPTTLAHAASNDEIAAATEYAATAIPGLDPELIEAAAAEGTVTFYVVTNPGNDAVLAAFRERFPFVDVEVIQLPGGPLIERYLAEERAGQHVADVVQATSRSASVSLVDEGLVSAYTPTSAAAFDGGPVVTELIYPYQASTIGVAFREGELNDDQLAALDSWSAFTDPALWQGTHFGVLDVSAGGSTLLVNTLFYSEYDAAVWETLDDVGANIYGGTNPATEALLREEIDVIAGASTSGFFSGRAEGGPIAWRTPTPTLLLPTDVMLAAQPPHPNAARLLIEFILSLEAQEIYTQFGGVSLRSDFAPVGLPLVVEGAEWYQEPDMGEVYAITEEELAGLRDEVVEGWSSVFQ